VTFNPFMVEVHHGVWGSKSRLPVLSSGSMLILVDQAALKLWGSRSRSSMVSGGFRLPVRIR
jgi:hypothetical protein